MSYLARLSARAHGSRTVPSVALPKGLRRPAPISRLEEATEEEDVAAPARMTKNQPVRRLEETSEEVEPVSRQEIEEEPEAQRADAPLGPEGTVSEETEEEDIAPLRRQEEEEEELAPLRREEVAQEEEEIAPLRRQEEEQEEEVLAMRTVYRQEEVPLEESAAMAPPPPQSDLTPEAQPAPPELAGEEEPSNLQALRREARIEPTPTPVQSSNARGNYSVSPPLHEATQFNAPLPAFDHEPTLVSDVHSVGGNSASQSEVVIEQLDVVIHEPQASSTRAGFSGINHSRAMRARYLRRL